MAFLDLIKQFLENSDISKIFGLDSKTTLEIVVGSLIIGLVALTVYYYVYKPNKEWHKLKYFEKSIIAFIVGFSSFLFVFYIIAILGLFLRDKSFDKLFSQTLFLGPFFYFSFFSIVYNKFNKSNKNLIFIKKFINFSFFSIFGLNYTLFILITLYVQFYFTAVLEVILAILFLYLIKNKKKNNYKT